jgi:hypothetical protein
MLIRINGRQPNISFREKFSAMTRFVGTLVRSVNPRAERAPTPELSLPNVGGAIIPALGRRWRARS